MQATDTFTASILIYLLRPSPKQNNLIPPAINSGLGVLR